MTLFSIIKEIKPENITKIKDAVKSVPVVLDKITQAVKKSQPNYDVPTVEMVEQAKKAGDLEYAFKLDQARIGALPKTEMKSYQEPDVSDDHLIEMVADNQRSQGDIRPSRQVQRLPSFSPENKLPLLKAYATLPEEKKKKIDANVIWKQGEELYKSFYREKYNLPDTQVVNIPEEKREEVRQEWLKAPDLKKTQIYQKVMAQTKPVDEAKELMQRQERGMTLGFYKQLQTIYGEEKAKKIENQVVAAESQGRMVRGAVLNFFSGATLGVSDVVARSLMQDTPESLYGDDQKLTTYYTESKQIADAFDSVKNVTDFAASMSGGLLSYGAISKRVSQVLSKVPGPAGEWMAAHPVLTAYTVQGVGEEVVDMSIRKITGQQYGWSEFMMGMAMNTAFESVFRGAKKGMEAFSAWKENKNAIGLEIESKLAEAEKAKGSGLTQQEVAKTISPIRINDRYSVGDLFKEARTAYKTGGFGDMNGRMTLLRGNQGVPSVTDVGVRIPSAEGVKPFEDTGDLTTKILNKLEGKTEVSKQFISDLTNSGDVKQVEKDLIRGLLQSEGSKVNVAEFADKVKAELLPLNVIKSGESTRINNDFPFEARYEHIALPEDLRGNVENYDEHLYQSPIKTSAGDVHYNADAPNYFGHTRIEDLADKATRRVIEIQSDLYQKGRPEESVEGQKFIKIDQELSPQEKSLLKEAADKATISHSNGRERPGSDFVSLLSPSLYNKINKAFDYRLTDYDLWYYGKGKYNIKEASTGVQKLQQYNNPTAHFRMVREELKRAAEDGKKNVLFPTGETAMKIEGLGKTNQWYTDPRLTQQELLNMPLSEVIIRNRQNTLRPEMLKEGLEINQFNNLGDNKWIVLEVLDDGKFKAVPKSQIVEAGGIDKWKKLLSGEIKTGPYEFRPSAQSIETFDISGKADTSNPIYKFYEKELGKYLKNNYEARPIQDSNGVSWMEVQLSKPKVMALVKKPVFAFKTGAGEMPDAGKISENAKMMSDLEKEQLPWETDAEWKARIGEPAVQEKVVEDFKTKEVPELEGKKYLKYQAEKMIQKHIDEVLKPGMKRGITQGGLSRDAVSGEVVGRTGRMSNNDKWYKDFYAKEGRAPKVSELRQIAVDQLLEGYKGDQIETEPDQAFIDLKAQMDEMGLKMPLKKLSQAGIKDPVKKPVTVAKEELKKLSNRKLTMAELGFQGEKGERLRAIKQEVAKRLGIEKKIKAGDFEAIKVEDLQKVRKSGGVGQAVLKLVDKGAGKITSEAVSLAGKVADKLTDMPRLKEFKGWAISKLANLTPQYGLDDDVYKALSNYRKAQNREFKGIESVLESLKSVTKEEGAPEKAFQYLSGEKVEISDELKNVLDPIRDEIDIEGLRQVLIGNLPKETYFANMGRYMRRLYASHNLEGFSPLAESYSKLKNAFIKKGLSEVDAEEAIVGIMGKNIKDKFKGVLPASIKTGGNFQKARKLGDDDLSLAIRDFLGEVQDPEYAIGRTLFDLKRSRLNYELLHELSGTGAVKDSVPAGYADEFKKLEGKEWGDLDGKFMQKDVFDYMDEMKGQDGELGKMLTKINNFIKANLTVRNPAGQFRNFTSNFSTSQAILGHNYLSVSGVKDLADAYKSLRSKDGFYQELVAYGRVGNTGITHDLGNRLEEVFKEAQSPGNDFLVAAKKIDNILGKSYEFGDNIFLMANYRKLRANGLEPIAAIKEASRVTPDYGEVSPLIAKWRRSVVGLPFVTWRYKVYPEILKEMIKSPVKASMPIWFPWAVGNLVASQLDLTEAEQGVFKAKLYRDGRLPLGRDENGDVVYFDYGQYTPFADMFKGRYTGENTVIGMLPEQLEGYAEGAIPGIGSFPMQMMLDLSNNYDPFTSRPITSADMWTPEWGWDIAMHVAPNLLPVVGLSVNNISKVAKGDMGPAEALLKSLTGMRREVTGVGRFAKEESYNTPGFSLDKEKSEIYKTVKDIAKLDPAKANEELNKLYDKFPEQESYISDRVRYEKDKVSGKGKIQSEIRDEVSSLFDISKKDKELANKRLNELYDKYPEYEKYITEKVEALKD